MQLKALTSGLVFVVVSSISLPTFSAPVKKSVSDKNLQIAMLDLNRLYSEEIKTNQPIPTKTRAKKVVVKKPLPANCMLWSAAQINQQAKTYQKSIIKHAKKHKVDTNLVKSVMAAESCFKRKALSHAGAQGLMQLIPDTAKRFGVKNSYNADQNIRGGVTYLRFLLDRFNGNLEKTLAGYNAGEGKVDLYKGIPPYKETQQYVKNVLKVYHKLAPKKQKKKKRVSAVYKPPSLGQKPGRHGWRYNRSIAPHLYKGGIKK